MIKKKTSFIKKIGKLVLAFSLFLFVLFYFILVVASHSILKDDYSFPLFFVVSIQISMVTIIVLPIYLWYRNTLRKESAQLKAIAGKLGFNFIPYKQSFGTKYFNEKKHSEFKFSINTRLILKAFVIILLGTIFSVVFYMEGRFPIPAPIAFAIFFAMKYRHDKQKIKEKEVDAYLDNLGLKRILKIGNISLNNVGSDSKLNGVHIKDIMEKFSYELQISIFDRTYTTRRGKSTSFIEDTITLLKASKLNIPVFTLAPERLGSSIEKYFGLKDVNFKEYPKFSSKYILSSENERDIKIVFSDKIIKFFEENDDVFVESGQNYILFTQKSSDPNEREILFTKYLRVAKLFLGTSKFST